MTLSDISNIRMKSQKIDTDELTTPGQIVTWMGAVQAQDYPMAKWALGTRLINPSDRLIESAINNADIIRIHVLRPTWHFVSADDVYWILKLTSSKLKTALKGRHKSMGLSKAIITKSNNLIENAFTRSPVLTRDEIAKELHSAKIKTDNNRLSHILFSAEMDGIICSGPVKDNKQTYSLLGERVPHKKELLKDESVAELVRRYFTSRYPATIEDFVWWSNLTLTETRHALDDVKSEFFADTIGSVKYWFPNSFNGIPGVNRSVHLLPAFDEFLISYRDRSSSLSLINKRNAVSDNGIFWPLIVIDGQVAGIWKRTIEKNKVVIETDFFRHTASSVKKLVENKAMIFGKFLNKETEVRHKKS